MKKLLRCTKCRTYTMKGICPIDSEETITPRPAKYSEEDRMGKYRRKAKENMAKEE